MEFSYNWLKDFLNIKIAPRQLADRLTMAGLEVNTLRKEGGDFIFEAEVTSNRPDWLSIMGIAREVAAITGLKFKAPAPLKIKPGLARGALKIVIADQKDSPFYSAKIMQGVKVGPSPAWLRERLAALGCRSVNNVVDATNYILFQYGQPLHAFDWDKLDHSAITVRRGRAGEKLTTIDGETKELSPAILVIADRRSPLAAAGIMGGRESEVNAGTKNILLESAVFNPVVVRRGKRLLGLNSESAYRFERGVDLGRVEEASLAAVNLIRELAGGSYESASSVGLKKIPQKKIALALANIKRILGLKIAPARIKKILVSLGLKVASASRHKITVVIPSFRQDLNTEIDLIEEVARIFGYENIPASVPAVAARPTLSNATDLVSELKQVLSGLGLNEVTTYSLIDKKLLEDARIPSLDPVEILNPLSREQEILRPTLIPSLVKCVSYNLNQKQGSVAIFEVANIFSRDKARPRETLTLGLALCGTRSCFLEEGHKDKFGMLHLKGIVEALFGRSGIRDYRFVASGNNVAEVFLGNSKVGAFLKLGREALEKFDIKNKEVVAAELNLEEILSRIKPSRKFSPLPLYPGILRDISLVVKEGVLADELLATIRENGKILLQEAKITDYYRGSQIPPGYKGLTISCLYRLGERTLTEGEVNPLHLSVCRALEEKFCAKIR